MDGYKNAFYVSTALLLGSVVLHFRSPEPKLVPAAPLTSSAPAAEPPNAEAAKALHTAQRELLRLRAELTRCQDQSWDMAANIVQGKVDPDLLPAGGGKTSTICAVSQAVMRKLWEPGKTVAGPLLGREMGSEAWVEADVTQRLQRHAENGELAQRDADALERGYRGLWHRHGERMRREAAAGNWQGLADGVRAFWKEEDALVADVLGADGARAFGDSEAALRTALLALFATYAEVPWDDSSLSW